MMERDEKQFLDSYDASSFEKVSITADTVILSVSDEVSSDYRRTNDKKLSVLLVKRNDYPFKGKWALPGGFMDVNKETLEDCALRVLKSKANMKDVYIEQLYAFDAVNRDPRMRVLSMSYIALVDKNKIRGELSLDVSWFDISVYNNSDDSIEVFLTNDKEDLSFEVRKNLKEFTSDRYDFDLIKNKGIAFDHAIMILVALERLKNKVGYTDIVFTMMPEYFTLGELQKVYEVILGKKLLDPAFRRIIADKVVKTEMVKTGGGHRPSYMYKYKGK